MMALIQCLGSSAYSVEPADTGWFVVNHETIGTALRFFFVHQFRSAVAVLRIIVYCLIK